MTSVEEFNCILCKESFDNKDELQTHFRKHGDPKFHESVKKNRSQIETTLPLANEKSNDATELVNCDVCEEAFPTISKAITHKHKVHPEHDAKYFCPWCGKLFTMKHLYNKHLQTNHNAVDGAPDDHDNHFHCDCCSVYFYVSSAMIYHNKFFHRQDTDLPIIGHSKKQRLWNQDLLPIYYCSFCGEEYINKVNLHKHICDDHGDENQRPTDVLRCPLCEAIFYHLDAYELHLTFHSSNDLYSESNEMNENELSEYSLETVPPAMERVEDLNNLPNVETDVNAIGIESFLQMAMDEPHDGNQRSKKVKSKKHKKHKKSKKPAITLDEFLNMNQDVFGEGLDFQGVEEVPTKVIKRQLIPRKPQIQKSGAKFVSSADLQKLQKAGIVVKMKPGNRPPPLKIRPVGQPVKVNPHVKNLKSQTQTKAISASNEVLSKLMNQSSNQLKIVKKTVHEKTNNDETAVNVPAIENTKNQPSSEDLAIPKNVEKDSEIESAKNSDERTALSNSDPDNLIENEGDDLNDSPANQQIDNCTNADSDGGENKREINENNESNNDRIKSDGKIPGGNSTVTSSNDFKDTLKNISSQITIKSITPPAAKAHVLSDLDKPVSPKGGQSSEFISEMPCNSDLKTEQIQIKSINKTLDSLKNINSAITVKSQKNSNILIDNRNSTVVQEKTDPNVMQRRFNTPEKVSVQNKQPVIENTNVPSVNKIESDQIKETTSSHVLKNISKNITVTSRSPSINQPKDDNINKDQDDGVVEEYNENPTQNKDIQKTVSTNLGTSPNVLKNLGKNITIKSMSPSVQLKEDNENKEQDDSEFDEYDENLMENKNIPDLSFQQSSSSNVLKNLGKNITVKSKLQSIKQPENYKNNEQHDSDFNEYNENPMEKKNIQNIISTNSGVQVPTSSHVLKNLSKNIIVKSTSQFVKIPKEVNSDEEEAASELDAYDECSVENKNIKKVASFGVPRNVIPRPKIAPDVNQKPINRLTSAIVQPEVKEENMSEEFSDKNSNIQSSDLLKHLKNITAKPVPSSKKNQQIIATSSNKTVKIAKGNNYTWKSVQKKESTEEIETFNIDDSDSDDPGQQQITIAPKQIRPIRNEVKPNVSSNPIRNKLNTVNFSDNRTKQIQHCADIDRHDSDAFSDDEIDNALQHQLKDVLEDKPRKTVNNIPLTTYKATTQKDETFKQVFKNLGKHITIKSKTASSQSIQHSSLDPELNSHSTNNESDEDPYNDKIKITDVTEENFSDDGMNDFGNKGIVTHSSEGSNSGDDHFPEDMDEFDEYESQPLATNAVNQNFKSPSESLLKNISKNITVKSLNERNIQNAGRCNVASLEKDQIISKNKLSNKLAVRPINQNNPDIRKESALSRNQSSTPNKRIAEPSTSNQSTKSIVPESSNVVNTINKEVKVKTFQSETVIEEVTTTVTKTIRRVNQVNQQVYNASQTFTQPKIIQQSNPRIANYNQQTKNFQGTTVRQTSPGMVTPKIRQSVPFRPPGSTLIRASNQPVPIRPNANIRPNSSPRMQIKNMPQQQRSIGKPLKIAPNAMNQIIKRPAIEDASGPFSCFKKPKESLIPGNEAVAGSSSDFHYTSTSQTSKFCSTAKIGKDSALVTKKQMRSESITQQKQMGRHGNISGLKVTQCKQVSQVERSEANASKRSALEAIEKLQKQGLLIKKPRVVEDFDPPNSDSEYNDEFQDEEE